jgi:cyclohexyl-isocyanide hydratase
MKKEPNRRDLMSALAVGGLVACSSSVSSNADGAPTVPDAPFAASYNLDDIVIPNGPPIQIVMLMYPLMTSMDFVGPQLFFATLGNVEVHMVAATMATVVTDTDLAIMPTATFATAPSAATTDLLFVPGGSEGTLACLSDAAVLDFVKTRGATAKYVTSVCTGSLILAVAGLLRGYRATSHWVASDLLSKWGATPVNQRAVIDRNLITGGGVTAGLDLGLHIAQLCAPQPMPQCLRLMQNTQQLRQFRPGRQDWPDLG